MDICKTTRATEWCGQVVLACCRKCTQMGGFQPPYPFQNCSIQPHAPEPHRVPSCFHQSLGPVHPEPHRHPLRGARHGHRPPMALAPRHAPNGNGHGGPRRGSAPRRTEGRRQGELSRFARANSMCPASQRATCPAEGWGDVFETWRPGE